MTARYVLRTIPLMLATAALLIFGAVQNDDPLVQGLLLGGGLVLLGVWVTTVLLETRTPPTDTEVSPEADSVAEEAGNRPSNAWIAERTGNRASYEYNCTRHDLAEYCP